MDNSSACWKSSWVPSTLILFGEVEYSGGNCLVPALERFCRCIIDRVVERGDGDDARSVTGEEDGVRTAWANLEQTLSTRFRLSLLPPSLSSFDIEEDAMHDGDDDCCKTEEALLSEDDDEEDDEDGPVVVPLNQVEASLPRSAGWQSSCEKNSNCASNSSGGDDVASRRHRESYPFLFAAIVQNEDVLMACARILNEANDVSLVREAAAYLEEVESMKF